MMIPVGILSAIFIYPAIYLLYGVEYLPIFNPFLILLTGVVFSSITGTLLIYFMGVGKPGVIVQTLVLPVIIQLVLGSWAVHNYGVNGAAAVLSLGMVLAGSAQLLLFIKTTNIGSFENMVCSKDDVQTVLGFAQNLLSKRPY